MRCPKCDEILFDASELTEYGVCRDCHEELNAEADERDREDEILADNGSSL